MYDPIYTGWGNRAWISGRIKHAFTSRFRESEYQKLEPNYNAVSSELGRLGLLREEGLLRLAGIMAQDILQSFEEPETDYSTLPFFTHLQSCIKDFLEFETLFQLPSSLGGETPKTTSQLWMMEEAISRPYRMLMHFDEVTGDIAQMFRWFVSPIIEQHPTLLSQQGRETSQLSFDVPLSMVMNNLDQIVERIVQMPFAPEFETHGHTAKIQKRLEYNVVLASGGNPSDPDALGKTRMPTKNPSFTPQALIEAYLNNTPFAKLFDLSVPIAIPEATRFEHQYIVAGSGHGKTQTLQHLVLHDLQKVVKGNASIVVIDSQRDLINNIRKLSIFAEGQPLANRLIVIDPTDVEYPVSLNLFDANMDRINQYSQLDRERMVNGILELYDFVLGSLLSAEMTQKQSVIFRYITRLMLHIPNATIHTLRELLEDGGSLKYQQYIDTLEGSARAFFRSEFDSKEFVQTKRQVVRRLWGILENQSFERMFSHPKNKLDLYSEMNAGKVILINTAKDLLKENGTEIFGRFFIAMIAQAAQERAVIPQNQRMPTYVYVDEANDYFDRNIGIILSQARKYKVGMILANQFLGQMESKLQEAIFANTSIKFAGGVSAKEARTLANEMRTDASLIESQGKLSLAAYVRGTTNSAVSISVIPGLMERLPKMSKQELLQQREYMRHHFARHYTEAGIHDSNEENNAKSSTNNSDDAGPDEPMEWE